MDFKKPEQLLCLLTLTCFSTSASNIKPVKDNVVGAFGKNASLRWQIPSSNEHSMSFILMSPKNVAIVRGDTNRQLVTKKGIEIYGNRISAVYGNHSYVVTISSLLLNDAGYYRLTVALKNYVTTAIHLKVEEPIKPTNTTTQPQPTNTTDPSKKSNRKTVVIIVIVVIVVLVAVFLIVFVVVWKKRHRRQIINCCAPDSPTDEELHGLDDKETT